MTRLLFLCLLLTAVAASSDVTEGSADGGFDDEDLFNDKAIKSVKSNLDQHLPDPDKATGGAESDQLTLIVIIVAVTLVALSVAVVIGFVLVRRHIHSRQQGIYSVPTEQGLKGAV
ncbi:uncharacterized protein LOC143008840 [Genypterus blacodes]|uniref:uncharacterized protein LOC143008840 n=1 Tax=Genypterus blacodes TaxID=154954 RepID=UPI003F777B34